MIEGADALRAALAAAPGVALAVGGIALYGEANDIMNVSKTEVPVDKGILKASGHVELPVLSGAFISVTLGYGGAARAYAVIQHERTDYHHTVGKDHYLSDPFAASAAGREQRLAATIAATKLFPGLP